MGTEIPGDSMAASVTTDGSFCGGGSAGMMLGFLSAGAGVDIVGLENYGDFLRDFGSAGPDA